MGRHLLGSDERRRFGVIVSAVVNGQVLTRVGHGLPRPALEDAVEALERHGEIERVLSISTPETIYTDLQGSRQRLIDKPNPGMQLPEAQMLTKIGRSDLVPPPPTTRELHKRTERLRAQERLLAETGRRAPEWREPKKRIRIRPRRPRCQGTTFYGKRCKFQCLPGQDYCSYHSEDE